MHNELIKIAQTNIREAMITEFARNRQVIDSYIMNRRTPRHIKEHVFYAMARNNAITHFLRSENPSPEDLVPPFPIDNVYWELMQRVGATRYPFKIRYRAERDFLENYTHLDYKRTRYFLDVPLPDKPLLDDSFLNLKNSSSSKHKLFRILHYIGRMMVFALKWSYTGFWVVVLGGIMIIAIVGQIKLFFFSEESSEHNTFNQAGVADGNYSPSWSSDNIQILDASDQAGFGNNGNTVYDDSSKLEVEQPSSAYMRPNTEKDEVPSTKNIDAPEQEDQNTNTGGILADSLLTNSNQESFHTHKGQLTLGSTKEEVAKVLGNPDSSSDSSYVYGFSQINFKNGRIVGWFTIDQPLEISLGEKKNGAAPFTIGSSKQQVVDAMGTPSAFYNEAFEYQLSRVNFNHDNKVIGWYTVDEPLNVEIKSDIENARPFTIGSTIEEVVAIMGTPDTYSNTSLGYEYSNIYIQDGKVSNYSDISHNLLTTEERN